MSEQAGLITFKADMLSAYAPGLQRNLIRRALEQIVPRRGGPALLNAGQRC